MCILYVRMLRRTHVYYDVLCCVCTVCSLCMLECMCLYVCVQVSATKNSLELSVEENTLLKLFLFL